MRHDPCQLLFAPGVGSDTVPTGKLRREIEECILLGIVAPLPAAHHEWVTVETLRFRAELLPKFDEFGD